MLSNTRYGTVQGHGAIVPQGLNPKTISKLGNFDAVQTLVLTYTAAQLNALVGAGAKQLVEVPANTRARLILLDGHHDSDMTHTSSGVVITFSINGVTKGVVTHADATAGDAINVSTAATDLAGATGKDLNITVTGATITSSAPISLRVKFAIEKITAL